MNEAKRNERRLDRLVSRHWWEIAVTGYGSFAFYGTEHEAEEMRAHKANWEHGVATKQQVRQSNRLVREQVTWVRHEIEHGYPRSSDREKAETAVVMANP
ncbi:hypothetical protein CS053_08555 [Rhodanobacter glycinis]|uniref:Uncharacterized protein n=1 Tax=Rhodanobacter glycinis TaxID=582702 RepID=A0A5B9E2T6_9GAMM|nr:hypothetical protein [Rhodanobacter glycinis]QEE24547.1 hypothetical protein CS053_08555 [Rhodanobacter glycinis]